MRIVCAPDSFKECLSASQVAEAMAAGVRMADPDGTVDFCPIADGGEGTVDAIMTAVGGEFRSTVVSGPLREPTAARWGLYPDRGAVIEIAAAAGLHLVPTARRDPTATTTFGVGQLILAAAAAGVERLIVGLGGSATNDGGCGMAQALGIRFLDRRGRAIEEPLTGARLPDIRGLDIAGRDPSVPAMDITGACDVTNPLTGTQGAAQVFAGQKGADSVQIEMLAAGLSHLAVVIRRELGIDVERIQGGGAAGGLGAGLVAFSGARLAPGIDLVLDAVDFDRRVRAADLCLTGEGRLDAQSSAGKACLGVARAAARYGVPTIALVGARGPGAEADDAAGLERSIVIGEGLSREESMRRAAELLRHCAAAAVREFRDER